MAYRRPVTFDSYDLPSTADPVIGGLVSYLNGMAEKMNEMNDHLERTSGETDLTIINAISGGSGGGGSSTSAHTLLSHSDCIDTPITPGSILRVSSTSKWQEHAIGTNGDFLRVVAGMPEWDAVTTDDIPEGATNLYWTQARFDTAFAAKDTDDLAEGATNLYYTQARFDAAFAAKSTTDLAEGANLYFTNERVDDRVDALIQDTASIVWTYNDGLNQLSADVQANTTVQKVAVRKNSAGGDIGTRRRLNFIEGTNITLTITDDGGADDEIDITIDGPAGMVAHDLLSAAHSDTLASAVSRGSLIVGNSTPLWSELTIGAASTVLHSDGTDASWAALVDADIPNVLTITAISNLTSDGFVKTSGGAGTLSIDTNTYLTSVTAHNVLSATHGDTLATAVVRGSLIVGNSTPKWSALAIGAANRLLRSDGTDASWAQVVLTTDVTGTLPVANGGTSVTALSDILGTANQITVGSGAARVIGGNVTLSVPSSFQAPGDVRVTTYLRVGSLTAPANTTAGDVTTLRITNGSNSAFANETIFQSLVSSTSTSATVIGANIATTAAPASASSAQFEGVRIESRMTGSQNYTGVAVAIVAFNRFTATGNGGTILAMNASGWSGDPGAITLGTITEIRGIQASAISTFTTQPQGTVTQAKGIDVLDASSTGAVTGTGLAVTRANGITIREQTRGTNNVNLLIGTGTIPSADYSIYNSSTKVNYFGAGLRIGTAGSPARDLSVVKSAADAGISLQSSGGSGKTYGITSDTSGNLNIQDDSDSDPLLRLEQGGGLLFFTNAATRFKVSTTGNVFFGASTAGTSLTVGLVWDIGTAPTAAHPANAIQMWVNNRNAVDVTAGLNIRSESGQSYIFADRSGFGTLVPNYLNSFYRDDTATDAQVAIEQDGSGDATLLFEITGGEAWMMGIDNSDSDIFKIGINKTNLATSNFVAITGGGKVGLGTAAPDEILHVVGNAKITSKIYQDDVVKVVEVSASGTVTSRTVTLGVRRFDSVASSNTRFVVHVWGYTTDITTPALQTLCTIGNLSAGKRLSPTVTTDWSPETGLDTLVTDASGNFTFTITSTGTTAPANQNFAVEVQGIIFTFGYSMNSGVI